MGRRDELKSLKPWRNLKDDEAKADLFYILDIADKDFWNAVLFYEKRGLAVRYFARTQEPKIDAAERPYIFLSCLRVAAGEYRILIKGYSQTGDLLIEEELPWREADKDPSEIFEAIRRTANRLQLK